jgi:3-oxoadipate enol-lactonase/4-carboxymuconolactone decarboxylase
MSEFFALTNGDLLYFDEYGARACGPEGRRSTLVGLHGLGGGGYFFAGVGHSLASGIRSVFPDLPGSGFSRRDDGPVSFDRFTDDLVQLIKRKTDSPITLMGHSMGTILALKVYARIPDRIVSMIFVGGLPAPLPEAQARLRDRAALARSAGMAAVAPSIVPVIFARKSLDAIPDKVMMFQRLLAQSDAEGYAQTALALADASAAEVVPRVRVPCLCVTGAEDRYAPPAAVRCFADSIQGGSYRELADCAHMPFFEAPDAFNEIVQGFLAQVR